MSKIQNATGKSFEDEFMQYWKDKGYWTIKTKGIGGTAFDILAKNSLLSFAFECKTVAKGNYLPYTRELQKKTDELDYYNDIADDLFVAVRFSDGVYTCEWRVAKLLFQEYGKLGKEEMIPVDGVEHYQSADDRYIARMLGEPCEEEPCF